MQLGDAVIPKKGDRGASLADSPRWLHASIRGSGGAQLPVKHSRCPGAAVCSWALTEVLQRTPGAQIACPPADAADKGCARQQTAMHRFPDAGGDLLGSLNLLVLPPSSCSTWPSAVGGLGRGVQWAETLRPTIFLTHNRKDSPLLSRSEELTVCYVIPFLRLQALLFLQEARYTLTFSFPL